MAVLRVVTDQPVKPTMQMQYTSDLLYTFSNEEESDRQEECLKCNRGKKASGFVFS
jgi:hypothetical protein